MGKNVLLSAAFLATSSIGQLVPGFYGPQVAILQELLNKNAATIVAQNGPGSPGQETDYFGPKTLAALKRFQSVYASDILAPLGLTAPTGFLGPRTLEKLNEIGGLTSSPVAVTPSQVLSNVSYSDPLAPYRVPTGTVDVYATDRKMIEIRDSIYSAVNTAIANHMTPSVNPAAASQTLAGAVLITNLSTQYALPGTKITIAAQNLDVGSSNNIYFTLDPGGLAESTGNSQGATTTFVIKNISSSMGSLSFNLPQFPSGRYDVAIQNSHGISNSAFFVIAQEQQTTVAVTSLSSSTVRWGGSITVYGSGFTKTGNEIFTPFDTIPNVSSPDGHSLTVNIAPEQMKEDASLGSGNVSVPSSISVVNGNGYTVTPKSFSIKI